MTNPTPAKREESVGVVGRKKIAVASVLTAWPSLLLRRRRVGAGWVAVG